MIIRVPLKSSNIYHILDIILKPFILIKFRQLLQSQYIYKNIRISNNQTDFCIVYITWTSKRNVYVHIPSECNFMYKFIPTVILDLLNQGWFVYD